MKISEINKNPKNPRKIKGEQLNKLMESIQRDPEFMKLRPIVIDENNMILGGNQRYTAIKKLGMKEIPDDWIARAENLTEEQRKRFILVDNGPEGMTGEWDFDALQAEWELPELESLGFDISDYETPQEPNEGLTDADEIPEEPEPVCKLGDLWRLGEHRLLCGDSTKEDNVALLMNGEKADMVFTDPPYGMKLDTDFSGMESRPFKGKTGGNYHSKVIGDGDDFTPELIDSVLSNFEYCSEIFLWGADYYAELIKNKNYGSWIVWDKRIDDSAGKMWGSEFELCWSKNKHKRSVARIKWAGIFGMETQDTKKRVHPTQKPVELVLWFFDNWCKNLKLCVDLYVGSGSTLIACEKTNRKCYGMEIDPKYCDVIIKRWENFTGKKAEKL